MAGSVFKKTLSDQRRFLLWWALGLIGVIAVYVAPYQQYIEQFPADLNTESGIYGALGMQDLTSPEGYLHSTFFALLGALLMIMVGVILGARAIAGDEENGMLDLILAHPVSRTRLVAERFASLAVALLLLGAVVWVGILAAAGLADMAIPIEGLTAAVLGLVLVSLLFGTVALAIGALTGRRSLTLGLTAAIGVTSYLVNNLASQVGSLEDAEKVSPFYYYVGVDPLQRGLAAGPPAVLAVTTLALLVLSVWAFNRRDVAV